jgi:hypothetical protein
MSPSKRSVKMRRPHRTASQRKTPGLEHQHDAPSRNRQVRQATRISTVDPARNHATKRARVVRARRRALAPRPLTSGHLRHRNWTLFGPLRLCSFDRHCRPKTCALTPLSRNSPPPGSGRARRNPRRDEDKNHRRENRCRIGSTEPRSGGRCQPATRRVAVASGSWSASARKCFSRAPTPQHQSIESPSLRHFERCLLRRPRAVWTIS